MQVVSLSFYRFETAWDRAWALGQMGFARRALKRVPHIGFHKLLGSGTGEGFTPIPNWSVYAILAIWPDREIAEAEMDAAPVFQRYRGHAVESWTVFLEARSVRGQGWAHETPFQIGEGGSRTSPIAVLTRATVRPWAVFRFWRHVPGIEAVIPDHYEGLLFKIGLGEVPWLHQVTFSIWRTPEEMEAFAYQGPHRAAARESLDKGWFSEDLFARFAVLGGKGEWEDHDPLAHSLKERSEPREEPAPEPVPA
ncbi:MAG: spheroidene monooxygenase [Alphaproteobacteria bacterium]|nr:spheroidene monooxygenase [Alphaproteobacteria bacterium]